MAVVQPERGTLVLAGLSVRWLAELAAAEGWRVAALDCFGDADTRAAAAAGWWSIADAAQPLQIDPQRLLAQLQRLAATSPAPLGWMATGGLDGQPALLAAGAALLPWLGTPAPEQAQLRDARRFFATLDALGLAHPPVAFTPQGRGWLRKQADGSGGWQVWPAEAAPRPAPAGCHWQLARSGVPMSATLLCAAGQARVLGINRQLVEALGGLPHAWAGVIGPLPVAAPLQAWASRAAQALAARHPGLCGLASLDFLLVDGTPEILELNPRPSASTALYPQVQGQGVVQAHLQACLPPPGPAWPPGPAMEPAVEGRVRGLRVVYLPEDASACRVTAALLRHWQAALATLPGGAATLHDRPGAGCSIPPGAPLCSVAVAGPDAATVLARLQAARAAVLAGRALPLPA